MFTPWEEVFSSTDLAEVMKRETVLDTHGIHFKMNDDSLRLGMSNRGGMDGVALSRGGFQTTTYRILVKKDKAEIARYYLDQEVH